MKYVEEFRNRHLIARVSRKIRESAPSGEIRLMEVCGTHTQNFYRFGLDTLLPPTIKLIAGPGCPVCVSSQEYIDKAIEYARQKETLVLTFADMLRVPGTESTLEKERGRGAQVQAIYSPLDTLKVARKYPKKKILFLGVGFETTAPTIALSVLGAQREKLNNIFFFNSLKLIPPVLKVLVQDKRLRLSGFLCPGHVSSIIGTKAYAFIPARYGIGCCVAGFEPLDIMEGIYLLLRQIATHTPQVANQYIRAVTREGNRYAQKIISSVFKVSGADWRGLGVVPQSGLVLKGQFARFDAEKAFPLQRKAKHKHRTECGAKQELNASGSSCFDERRTTKDERRKTKCRCADVLKGVIVPPQCQQYGRTCTPDTPLGPCMVSQEGACNAYYRYKK